MMCVGSSLQWSMFLNVQYFFFSAATTWNNSPTSAKLSQLFVRNIVHLLWVMEVGLFAQIHKLINKNVHDDAFSLSFFKVSSFLPSCS